MKATPVLAENFAVALHMAAHAWKLALDRRLKPLGLSRAAWMALATAAKAKTPPTQAELAEAVGIEGPSMVSLIDRLEKAGLAKRIPDPEDRRVRRIAVSASGLELFARIRQEAAASRKLILADIPAADIASALTVLEHIRTKAEASP